MVSNWRKNELLAAARLGLEHAPKGPVRGMDIELGDGSRVVLQITKWGLSIETYKDSSKGRPLWSLSGSALVEKKWSNSSQTGYHANRGKEVTRRINMFKEGSGTWTQYRELHPKPMEVDFHLSDYGSREIPYWEAMDNIRSTAYEALKRAYNEGVKYVLFTHGSSTSELGKTTARSQVRGLMRSSDATPYIHRSHCIQHKSVFVAVIRRKPASPPKTDN